MGDKVVLAPSNASQLLVFDVETEEAKSVDNVWTFQQLPLGLASLLASALRWQNCWHGFKIE